jgi:signal transduction histidine kinase
MVLNLKEKNRFLSIWVISFISTIVIILSLYITNINLGIENFSNVVSLPVYTIIPGTLVIFSIWAVTRSDSIKELSKKSLIFLSLSFIFWFLAEQTWNLYEHVFEIDPYPSIADFFYLVAPISMLISISIFLKSIGKKISRKNTIVACVVSSLILIPSLLFTLEAGIEDDPLEIVIAISYPIVDSVLLVPVIIAIFFVISNKRDFFLIMILAGLIIMITADTIFLHLVILDQYEDGHPVDILWVSAYTIWSFMMIFVISESKKYEEKKINFKIYKKYGSKNLEKYGVLLGLVFINSTVVIILLGFNYFVSPSIDDTMLSFFSWIFVMTIIIFSSIVILLNSRLNKVLQNRTIQLERTTNELIKSERFSAIGELASRVSHDIRNPLSNLNMSIELIKNSPPGTKITDDIIHEKLEAASKNIERISHQVNDVLGFVKNRQLKKENFLVSGCVQEAIESINTTKNITIQLPKSEIKISADFFQLQIVFNNLIINAIQAIDKNKGEILIRISEDSKNKIIEIENSGPPIPEDILPHIFDSLVTTKQVGTGLGLVSCKTIIENHKGAINVKNNPTTFIITIPKS